MWTPRSFRVEDKAVLHDLIRQFSFGVLFSQSPDGPVATHLPFMIDGDRGPNGTLIAHMARANPHWKSWTEETELLAVFQGPHAYISPAWYEDQETVPTWNYATLHAYGRPNVIHDPDQLRPMVTRLVDLHEGGLDYPWDSSQMESVMEVELKAIVGFEIPIDRMEGKYKFNQNRSVADQRGVAEVLGGSDEPALRAVGEIMSDNVSRSEQG